MTSLKKTMKKRIMKKKMLSRSRKKKLNKKKEEEVGFLKKEYIQSFRLPELLLIMFLSSFICMNA